MTQILPKDDPVCMAFDAAMRNDLRAAARATLAIPSGRFIEALITWIDTMLQAQGITEISPVYEIRSHVMDLSDGGEMPVREQPEPVRLARRLIECRLRDDMDGFVVLLHGIETGQQLHDVVMTLLHVTAMTTDQFTGGRFTGDVQ